MICRPPSESWITGYGSTAGSVLIFGGGICFWRTGTALRSAEMLSSAPRRRQLHRMPRVDGGVAHSRIGESFAGPPSGRAFILLVRSCFRSSCPALSGDANGNVAMLVRCLCDNAAVVAIIKVGFVKRPGRYALEEVSLLFCSLLSVVIIPGCYYPRFIFRES